MLTCAVLFPNFHYTKQSITGNMSSLMRRENIFSGFWNKIFAPKLEHPDITTAGGYTYDISTLPPHTPKPSLWQRFKDSSTIKWISDNKKKTSAGSVSIGVIVGGSVGGKYQNDKCKKLKKQRREKNLAEIDEARRGLRSPPHHKRDLAESEDLNIYSHKGGGGGGGGHGAGGHGGSSSHGSNGSRGGSAGKGGTSTGRGFSGLHPGGFGGYGGSAPAISNEDMERKKKKAAELAEQQYASKWDWSVPNCGSAWPY